MRANALLFVLACTSVTAMAGKSKPMTTCDDAWLQQHNHRTSLVLHVQVDDPAHTVARIHRALRAENGIVTNRSQSKNTHDLRVSLSHKVDVAEMLQEDDPIWTREQEVRRQQNVALQCEQLLAARRVAGRLETWITEAQGPHEKQSVMTMYQTHIRQVQNLDNQIRNVELNAVAYDLQLKVMQRPPDAQSNTASR